MNREEGYYFVKHEGDWEVMWWGHNCWLSVWESNYIDSDFEEIDETPITHAP
jgi:hypothetical protein